MNRKEKALKIYSEGFNCAQSVIASFADILELDEEKAIRLASGFGGGMGKTQETCGAATGAYMVIGFLRGKLFNGNEVYNEDSTLLVQEFSKKFREQHTSTNCKALIKYNLNSTEELEQARKEEVFSKKCSLFVSSAVEILEDILKK